MQKLIISVVVKLQRVKVCLHGVDYGWLFT